MKVEKIVSVFSNLPTLETERLLMRRMVPDDCRDMYEYSKREDVTEYLLWSTHNSVSYTLEYLRYLETRYNSGSFYDWGLVLKSRGKLVGTCGFTRFDAHNDSAEIGYVINPAFSGIGIATEAAGEVVRFGFEVMGLNRIEARFMLGNNASLAVMKKIGMSFEGYQRDAMLVKGKYRTIGTCAILRREYYCKKADLF